MAIDAAAALESAQTAYLANVPPFTSVAQAAAFIGAASQLLMLLPSTSGSREGNIGFDVALIARERLSATAWLEAHGGSAAVAGAAIPSAVPSVTRASFRNFRD